MNSQIIYINFPIQDQLMYNKDQVVRYHNALCREMERYIEKEMHCDTPSAVYFGGDISYYPPNFMLDIIGILKKGYCIENVEITAQVQGCTLLVEHSIALQEVGINRLNFVLQKISSDIFVNSWLKKMSQYCKNIAVDFVFDAQSVASVRWKKILDEFLWDLVHHCSLQFVEGDAMGEKENNDYAAFYYEVAALLEKKELHCYEYFHYARSGYQSRYMSGYWNRALCKGFGAGAHSFNGIVRYANKNNVEHYMACIESNRDHSDFFESLSSRDIFLEKLMMGMRQIQGFVVADLLVYLSTTQRRKFLAQLDFLVGAQLMFFSNGRAGLRRSSLFFEQEVIKKLLA